MFKQIGTLGMNQVYQISVLSVLNCGSCLPFKLAVMPKSDSEDYMTMVTIKVKVIVLQSNMKTIHTDYCLNIKIFV